MNPDRFDTVAKMFAGRVSRRTMVRGTGAGMCAAAGVCGDATPMG